MKNVLNYEKTIVMAREKEITICEAASYLIAELQGYDTLGAFVKQTVVKLVDVLVKKVMFYST